MKQVQLELGGRPFANDDLAVLQQELTDAVQAQFLGKGPFILTGCVVSGPATGAAITAGILCLDGQLVRFAGQSGVVLPAQFQLGATVASDPRPYQTGGTKFCAKEIPAVLVPTDPTYKGGEFLPVDTWGGKSWEDVQRAQQWELGDIKPTANVVTANYDAATGVGKPGTRAWGWAFADGQNGRAALGGQFIAGLDLTRSAYDAIGKTGGAETVSLTAANNGEHAHVLNLEGVDGGSSSGATYVYGAKGAFSKGVPTMQNSGSGAPHENRPPFYVLAMLQWVGY